MAGITIKQFEELECKKKALEIKEHGSYIDSYFENDFLINVYAISDFFVEVIINIRNKKVEKYVSFEKGLKRGGLKA